MVLTNESTYHPKGYGTSPALARARAPFRTKNAITGLTIASFAVGVWAYSISAVRQDEFNDIDAEAAALSQQDKAKRVSIEDQLNTSLDASSSTIGKGGVQPQPQTQRNTGALTTASSSTSTPQITTPPPSSLSSPSSSSRSRSLTPSVILWHLRPTILDNFSYSRLRSPRDGTLVVWGAPPLNRLGTLGDRKISPF